MPRRPPARPADAASLRAVQQRLGQLSVPALLRVRDAVDELLQRPRLHLADLETVIAAAGRHAP